MVMGPSDSRPSSKFRKPTSNAALWMTIASPAMNSRNSPATWANRGLSLRNAVDSPCTASASGGTSRSGLMKRWNSRPEGMRLTSSMQPISISRSPPFGLRPVVSVSRMISRMHFDAAIREKPSSPVARISLRVAPSQRGDYGIERGPARLDIGARVYIEVAAPALLGVRQLPGEQFVELVFGQPLPLQQPVALHLRIGANDDADVDQFIGPSLE